MSLGGTYDFVANTPMGEQRGTFTVVPNEAGDAFTGSISGAMGQMDIDDGVIDGNTLKWTMKVSMPLPMKLDCEATVNGDQATGSIDAGMLGTMPLTAEKRG